MLITDRKENKIAIMQAGTMFSKKVQVLTFAQEKFQSGHLGGFGVDLAGAGRIKKDRAQKSWDWVGWAVRWRCHSTLETQCFAIPVSIMGTRHGVLDSAIVPTPTAHIHSGWSLLTTVLLFQESSGHFLLKSRVNYKWLPLSKG